MARSARDIGPRVVRPGTGQGGSKGRCANSEFSPGEKPTRADQRRRHRTQCLQPKQKDPSLAA